MNKRMALNLLAGCDDAASALFGLSALLISCDLDRLHDRSDGTLAQIGSLVDLVAASLAETTHAAKKHVSQIPGEAG